MEFIGLIAFMAAVFAGMYVLSALSRIVQAIERIERHLVGLERNDADANLEET